MRVSRVLWQVVWIVCGCMVGTLSLSTVSHAATSQGIDAAADRALAQFRSQVKGGDALLTSAKGVLIFPEVIQVGIGIGGEDGEGVLRIGGESVAYYSIAAGSIGFQLGAQRKSIVVAFLTDQALQNFRGQPGRTSPGRWASTGPSRCRTWERRLPSTPRQSISPSWGSSLPSRA